MMSVAPQKRRPFNVDLIREKREKSAGARSGDYMECSSVVTLFFAKKSSIRHLLALLGARHIVHVSGVRVKTSNIVSDFRKYYAAGREGGGGRGKADFYWQIT